MPFAMECINNTNDHTYNTRYTSLYPLYRMYHTLNAMPSEIDLTPVSNNQLLQMVDRHMLRASCQICPSNYIMHQPKLRL